MPSATAENGVLERFAKIEAKGEAQDKSIASLFKAVEDTNRNITRSHDSLSSDLRDVAKKVESNGRPNYTLFGLLLSVVVAAGPWVFFTMTRPAEIVNARQDARLDEMKARSDRAEERAADWMLKTERELGRLSGRKGGQ